MSTFNNQSVLADRDVNTHTIGSNVSADGKGSVAGDVKSMEYHRQVLQSKLDESKGQQSYVSPSDTIMSPCTAKLSALRNKQVGKAKPKSLFAKTSAKNLGSSSSSSMFGQDVQRGSGELKN